MAKIFLVLLGGAFGTGLRYFLSSFIYSRVKEPTFPYANLVINVSGSFLIGVLAELFQTRVLVAPVTRVALLTGVLGGYTTFSRTYECSSIEAARGTKRRPSLRPMPRAANVRHKTNYRRLALRAAFLLQ